MKKDAGIILIIGWFIFFILCLGYLMIHTVQSNNATIESCEKLGMEYMYVQEADVCIDQFNQAHYVKIDCEGFFNVDCNARIISIGAVRVK